MHVRRNAENAFRGSVNNTDDKTHCHTHFTFMLVLCFFKGLLTLDRHKNEWKTSQNNAHSHDKKRNRNETHLTHKCNSQQHLLQTFKFMAPMRQGQEPQLSCPSCALPLELGSGGGDWKDTGERGDGGVGGSSSSTGIGPAADSPEGAAWLRWEAWDWGGAWLWLWVCWRMFRHSPRQLSVAADVALSSSRSWSRQETGPLVGRESMAWTRVFCWPSACDITCQTTVKTKTPCEL